MYRPPRDEQDKTARTGRRMNDVSPDEPNMIWLITFTDVMGLMLTFFVLMFAMSTPEQKSFAEMTSALQSEFNRFYGKMLSAGPEDSIHISRIDYDRALDIRYLEALMRSTIAGSEVLLPVEIMPQKDHLVLSLPEGMLFDPGQAAVKPGATALFFALGGAFPEIKNRGAWGGNGAPHPAPAAGEDVSDWELSLSRAVAVAAVLDKVGYNEAVVVRGAGRGRYGEMEGIDEKHRLDLSRRVDIDIMNHDGRRRSAAGPVLIP